MDNFMWFISYSMHLYPFSLIPIITSKPKIFKLKNYILYRTIKPEVFGGNDNVKLTTIGLMKFSSQVTRVKQNGFLFVLR